MATAQDTSASAQKLPYEVGLLLSDIVMGCYGVKGSLELMKQYAGHLSLRNSDGANHIEDSISVLLPFVASIVDKVTEFEDSHQFEDELQKVEGDDNE